MNFDLTGLTCDENARVLKLIDSCLDTKELRIHLQEAILSYHTKVFGVTALDIY